MPGITNPYNLQMPSAGLIGRGSGAGRSTIMDAAAVLAFSNAVNKAGDTMTGALVVENSIKSCRDVGFLVGSFAGPGTSVLTFFESAVIWLYDGTGSCRLATNGTETRLNSDTVFGFSSGSPEGAALDTPIVRAAAGVTAFRNSTTAQQIRVSKTYTSDTNCEYLSLGFSGTYFDLVSRVGSAGGTNQPIRLGHLDAASTFTGLTVETNGNMTVSGSTITGPGGGGLTINDAAGLFFQRGGALRLVVGGSGLSTYADLYPSATASYDLGLTTRYFRTLYIGSIIASGAITASGNLTLQNSTTAVLAELSKTYTSSTNREYFNIGFTGTNYDLCSRVGSAGGSNQPIRVGHIAADGTTFAGVTVTTGGALQIPAGSKSAVSIQTGTGGAGYGLYFSNSGTSPGFGMAIGSISYLYTGDSNSGLVVHSGWGFCFGSSGADSTPDAKLSRKSSGLIAARGNSGFSVRNYADSSDAALTCAAITASGNITYVPATSVITLSTNGQCAIEFTSNTTGNIVYRGSDGTTRRFAFTVS